jgi:sirohydrochlorin ferrochelatase
MTTIGNASTRGADSSSGQDGRWGVVLLAHGSQRGASRAECSCFWQSTSDTPPSWCPNCPSTPNGLQDAAQRLQVSLGGSQAQVILSCLEFIEPHPDQAVRILREQGLRRVVVAPFLLGNGKHATEELDEVLEDLRLQEPTLQFHLAGGFGAASEMAALVTDKIRSLPEANLIPSTEASTTGILIVKAGTKTEYDDCLWLEDLGRMVESQLGPGFSVAVAQSHYGDPTMESAAARLIQERGVERLVTMPYIFFPGMILKRNVLGTMELLQKAYPSVQMSVTPPLGMDDRVIKVTTQRVREVWNQVDNSED